jgi:hypothetical protein
MMRKKYLLILILVIGALGIGLGLDIANRGLFWRFAWSVTGREDAIGQIRGVVQYAGNVFRPTPRLDPFTPVNHAGVSPFGINTFLEQEPDPAKVEASLQMIGETGFRWIRQQFFWADIEIAGKGDFSDARNDMDGDGVIDVISAWAKYDRIVDLADENGIQIQARVEGPPSWARALPEDVTGGFAPPDNFQDYVDFLTVLAERYKGRIMHYQIWNEPNIYPEWGNNNVNPEAYTELLCMAHDALKAVDPNIVVISAALAPTRSLTGRDLNDYIFLQRMYQAGAGECFDVLSMQGYGLRSGPTDQRLRPTTVSVARPLYIRDLMVANGDGHKALWISEAAWNSVPSADVAPDIHEPRDMFGQVTPEKAAEYMVRLYQRAEQEWVWSGVMNYWFFTRRSDDEKNQPFYYFRMVEPYFDPDAEYVFPPLPVYHAIRDHIANYQPTLYQGAHMATSHLEPHHALNLPDDYQIVADRLAVFDVALQTSSANFHVNGTGILLEWRGEPELIINGQPVTGTRERAWYSAFIPLSTTANQHEITVTGVHGEPFILHEIMVFNQTVSHLLPYGILILAGLVMVVVMGVDIFQTRRQSS